MDTTSTPYDPDEEAIARACGELAATLPSRLRVLLQDDGGEEGGPRHAFCGPGGFAADGFHKLYPEGEAPAGRRHSIELTPLRRRGLASPVSTRLPALVCGGVIFTVTAVAFDGEGVEVQISDPSRRVLTEIPTRWRQVPARVKTNAEGDSAPGIPLPSAGELA